MNSRKTQLELIDNLLNIMDELRLKCPWDKKQTFESLRVLTIEETHELSEAIIDKDSKAIKSELGDLLLHVVDLSHPNFEEHIDSVNELLIEIKSINKPTLMVYNKIDAYEPEPWSSEDLTVPKTKRNFTIKELEGLWINENKNKNIFISALKKNNLEKFREETYKFVRKIHISRFPYNNFLYPEGLDKY